MMIFWGLVVVAVDINVGGGDLLLPDIAGYILIMMATTVLSTASVRFATARIFALAAAGAWFVSIFQDPPGSLISMIRIALDLAVTWYVCTGILELAMARANRDLAHAAATRRNWTLGASLLGLALTALAQAAPSLFEALVVPAVVAVFTVAVLVLLLIRRASLEIA